MRRPSFFVLAALACLLAPSALHAQAAGEAEVRAVVVRLFDAMRARDTAAVRSTMHSSARLMSTSLNAEGQPVLRNDPIDMFIQAISRAPAAVTLDERIANVRVEVDGRLATAWMDYSFYAGGNFSHCGVNAMQLFHDTDGWKFIQIADSRRKDQCGIPQD